MRRTAVLLMLLAVPALAQETPKPVSVFMRSAHYSMSVEVTPLANDAYQYNVTVIDLATNAVVAQPHLSTDAEHRRAISDNTVGDLKMRIAAAPMRDFLTASVEVSYGDTIYDSIRGMWALHQFQRPGGVTSAPVVGGVIGGVVTVPQRPLPPNTYRVGGDVKAPRVISRVEPAYTNEARKARVSGIVILETIIDKAGVVKDVQVLKPLPYGLDQAAVDAVKQWRFEPGMKDGVPVDVVFTLTVNFKLDTPPPPPAR